jgi:Holliday junction resolvasome RuvABC ATP-dependent DNA helicase subunit
MTFRVVVLDRSGHTEVMAESVTELKEVIRPYLAESDLLVLTPHGRITEEEELDKLEIESTVYVAPKIAGG